jgi:predicted ABC-type ATPase
MVTIMYLIVDSVDTCVSRVKERVRKGGHDVPESDIRRRYVRSMSNFWSIYRALADQWLLVYNGTEGIREIAIGDAMHSAIRDPLRWSSFMDQVRKDGDE